jgi:hypothetical protein
VDSSDGDSESSRRTGDRGGRSTREECLWIGVQSATEEAAHTRARAGAPVPVGARQGAPVHCMPAITNLGDLHLAYLEFKRFEAGTQALFLRERAHIKVGLGGLPFDRGPRDIATFSELHELVRKIVHTLMVGRY